MSTNVAGAVFADEEAIANPELQTNMLAVAKQLLRKTTSALSPAIVAANTTAEQSFAIATPAGTTDLVSVSKPSAQAGLGIVGWRIIDATHVGITFSNNTGGGLTPTAAEVYSLYWMGYNA